MMGKHITLVRESINEASRMPNLKQIMKLVNKRPGPYTLIVFDYRAGKLVTQIPNIKDPRLIPAHYRELEKKYPDHVVRLEDGEGHMVESINEELPTKTIDPKEFPNPLAGDTKGFLKKGKRDNANFDDVVKTNDVNIAVSKLKPSQDAIYLGKALGMAIGGVEGGDLGAVISKDNYILDGHHRYAATTFNNPSATVGGAQADLMIGDLVPVLRAVGDAMKNKRGLAPSGGDVNIFKATMQDVKDAVYDGKNMDSRFYNKEKAIEWFEKIGEATIAKRLKQLQSKRPPSGAPKRKDMPKITPDQVNIVKALLNKGKIDVKEPYANESVNEARFSFNGVFAQISKLDKEISTLSKKADDYWEKTQKEIDNLRGKYDELQQEAEEIHSDMEQEAEPEGGPIANRYGGLLQRNDNAKQAVLQKLKKIKDTQKKYNDDVNALITKRKKLQTSIKSSLKNPVAESVNEAYKEKQMYKRGDKVAYAVIHKGGVGKDGRSKGSEKIGIINKRKKTPLGRFEYQINGLWINDDEILGLTESVSNEVLDVLIEQELKKFVNELNEDKIMNENINEALSVNVVSKKGLNNTILKNADYEEHVNPDFVRVKLSNGKTIRIEKKRIKGGQRVYQAILQALDTYTENPKAKQFMDNLVTAMSQQLGESVTEGISQAEYTKMIKMLKKSGAKGFDIIKSLASDTSKSTDKIISDLEKYKLIHMAESVNEATTFHHSKGRAIEVGKDYLYTQGKKKRTIKIKSIDPKNGVKYYDFDSREYITIPVSTWNNTKAGHYMTPIFNLKESVIVTKEYDRFLNESFPDMKKWWKEDPDEVLGFVYWLQGQMPPTGEKKKEAWKKLLPQLQKKTPAPKKEYDKLMGENTITEATVKIKAFGDTTTLDVEVIKDKTGHPYVSLYENGEPYATITVILPETKDLPKDEFFAKGWSENKEIVIQLIKNKVLIPTGKTAKTGFVEAHSFKLNPRYK